MTVPDPYHSLTDVEWKILISDYRTTDGLKWPHRLTTSCGGKPYQDLRLGTFKINPKFGGDTFQPTKRQGG